MKILICGPRNSGSQYLITIINWIITYKDPSLPLKVVNADLFDVTECESFAKKGYYVTRCNSLEGIYMHKNMFDVIFLPIRDVRESIMTKQSDSNILLEILKNIMLFNMWKLSAHYIIKYENYSCEEIKFLSNILGHELTDFDAQHIMQSINDNMNMSDSYKLTNEEKEKVMLNKTICDYLNENEYLL